MSKGTPKAYFQMLRTQLKSQSTSQATWVVACSMASPSSLDVLPVDRLQNKPRLCFTECKRTEPLQSRDCRGKVDVSPSHTENSVERVSPGVSNSVSPGDLAVYKGKQLRPSPQESHSLIDHQDLSCLLFDVDVATGSLDCLNAERKTAADMIIMGRVGFY